MANDVFLLILSQEIERLYFRLNAMLQTWQKGKGCKEGAD